MRPAALEQVALICPRCRAPGHAHRLLLAETSLAAAGDVVEGILACPGCGARHPVLDGVPAIVRDLGAWLADPHSGALRRLDFTAPVTALLAEAAPTNLAAYEESHYGEQLTPLIPEARAAEGALRLDLGCGPGRLTLEAARGATLAVGLDSSLDFLRLARAHTQGEPVLWVAGDALDPPFEPGVFHTVAAWNLLDNVRVPFHLLGQMDALLAPGGLMQLSTPYAWGEQTDEGERIDGPAALKDIVTGLARGPVPMAYVVEHEEDGLPWRLRAGPRRVSELSLHVLRLRKPMVD